MSGASWIGVDFDGTLAVYDPQREGLGEPVPEMVARVKDWLVRGQRVKIVTAQASGGYERAHMAVERIKAWCLEHIGQRLEVTCSKDYSMLELWDDRAVRVEANTGRRLSPSIMEA